MVNVSKQNVWLRSVDIYMSDTHDTQWPRWEVFKQDNPKKTHQAVGSVHAVDGEHALLTAKSVFVRRPSAVSLWVVNAHDIYSVTQQELEKIEFSTSDNKNQQNFLVFTKISNRRSMTFVNHVGEVAASSSQAALAKAIETYTENEVLTWWIIAEDKLTKSEVSEDTVESWFAPAKEKTYRQQSEYGLVGKHPSERATSRRQKTKEAQKS